VVGIAGATALLALAAATIRAPLAQKPLPALPERPRIDVPLSGFLLAVFGVAVWGWTPVWLARWSGIDRPSLLAARPEGEPTALVILVSLLVSGWVGYTTYESLVANVADAEFLRLGASGKVLSVACGLVSLVAVAWLFLDGMAIGPAHGRMTSTLAIVALVALGNLLVTTGCGWCLARAAPKLPGAPWYVSLHHPAANVAHDLVLAGYVILCVAILRFGLALMPGSGDSFSLAQNVFPAIGMVAALLGYAKAMRFISAEFVKSEARRASSVLPRRSTLPPAELRQLWSERAEALGRRFDRKLTWSLVVSFVGIAPSAARTAWSIYADPATELQRVSRLSLLWLPTARRAGRSGTIVEQDQDDRVAEEPAAPEREPRQRSDAGTGPSDYPQWPGTL